MQLSKNVLRFHPLRRSEPPRCSQHCVFLRRATAAGIVLLVTGAAAVALPGRAGATTAVTGPQITHVDNPYLGAKGYINPEWLNQVGRVADGSKISNNPTSIWVDRVALAIGSLDSRRGLRNHLDTALAQGAGYVQVVLNNLPGKDCDRDWYGTGDFKFNEVDLYKSAFIDQVTAIESDPKYQSLRIINIVEPRWVQNLVLNTGNRESATSACDTVAGAGSYVDGVRYALTKLHRAGQNVYTYLDAGVYYELGWEDNAESALRLIVDAVKGTPDGFAGVDGFATNIAGYAPLVEPFFTIDTKINGRSIKQSKWVDWNNDVDEVRHTLRVREAFVAAGFSAHIGMIIDTSRNGWGGPNRPTKASTSMDPDTFVTESRVDRRREVANWCNQIGPGLGERPVAAPMTGIDAYAWIKTPGESDGSSVRGEAGTDDMCDPTYDRRPGGSSHRSGAMPNAPARGAWFPEQFTVLLNNAYPPLP
ncbi:MAG: cellulose 1,4-beta-cellobiosidase [Actinomycetota bacterium]|nr:cellulose 1,4-beta-cellobiosidase [Actinomycetota bacterium]